MEKTFLTLKEIQQQESLMLDELIKFFKNNNLKYYVSAGTFLGAVRHKGFIPWDDDVDLAMIRPEYDKFINILKDNKLKLSGDLECIGFELGNSEVPFIKVINKKIRVDNPISWEKYLWLDVFPLDGYPNEKLKYFERIRFYKKIYDVIMCDKYNIKNKSKNIFKVFFKYILKLILRLYGHNRFIKNYIKYCKKYDYYDCKYVRDNVWGDTSALIKKEELKTKIYTFENLKVSSFKDYDILLKRYYGDYMKLPPIEKRENHKLKAWWIK